MAARASRPKKATRWAVRPRAVAVGPELPHVVVLEVGVDEVPQGRPLGAEGARWRCRAGGGGRAGFVRGHGLGSSSWWRPRAGGVRPHSLWWARQARGMCGGERTAMCPRGVRARGEAMQIHLDRGGRRADRCYPSRGDWRRQNVLSPGASRSTCRLTRGEPLARAVSSRVARRRHADAAVSAAGRLSVSPGLQPTAPAITNAEAGLRPVWPARSTPLHPATVSVERALAPACHGRACRRAAVDGGPQWSVRRD